MLVAIVLVSIIMNTAISAFKFLEIEGYYISVFTVFFIHSLRLEESSRESSSESSRDRESSKESSRESSRDREL